MARFKRDEQRTYPIWWLIAGGLFIFSTIWACYAEFVTRVPWQKEQEAFFQMEHELAKRNLERVKNEFAVTAEPEVKKLKSRKEELKREQASGKYATAKNKVAQLNRDYADAEQDKTFGKSDLDEAYYYRQLAEYDRDAAEEEARRALEAADHDNGRKLADEMLADPPPLSPQPGVSLEMLHLKEEIARNSRRADQIDRTFGSLPGKTREAWEKARDTERKVVSKVKTEVEHQQKVDRAVNEMTRIDGPADPAPSEKDEKLQGKQRAEVCAASGARDTRHCLQWRVSRAPEAAQTSALCFPCSFSSFSLGAGSAGPSMRVISLTARSTFCWCSTSVLTFETTLRSVSRAFSHASRVLPGSEPNVLSI